MESAGSEIRLYRASGAGLVELARLSGVAPPRAVEGDLRAPEIGDNYGDGDAAGAGLFVALVQGRVIVDIARLLFVGGEPSDPDGGPDCYSGSNRSSSGDKPGSSGSTGEEEEEEISSNVTGKALPALSVSVGGLMLNCEDEEWVNPRKWDEKGEEDWKGDPKGHLRSSSWRSATEDSVSNFLEQQMDEGSSSKKPLRITSNFWRSGSTDSSTEEEDLHRGQNQELHQEGDEDWVFDDKDHLSDGTRSLSNSPRPAANEASGSHFNEALSSKKQVRNDESSSENEDQEKENDEERPAYQDQERNQENAYESAEADLSSTGRGQNSASIWKSGECDSISHERDQNPEKNNKKEEKDASQSIQIKLKLWPAQKHVLIKFFSGGRWVLTKDCILTWLNLEDVIEYNLKVEFGASFATLLGFRNTDCTMNFEVNMDCTPMLNDLMNLLRTSICNFQILKKVGEGGACKVFKCLFMGRKCALKSLTQENPWTLEPREVEIISNLKDTQVMIFYQAWIEPWAYKGQPEQDYLFIQLEFCQSTLKHALLYENRHWFPNRWSLFEEIVRTVRKLHEACVVHRDLKPDNIFFNSELAVRLGDFGDACVGHDEFGLYGGGTPKLGTEYYFALELNTGTKITEKADIYSLGVMLFELFAMFKSVRERLETFPNLREEGPHDSWAGDRQLYNMMTALEPSDRPSATQVLDYIHQHHSK